MATVTLKGNPFETVGNLPKVGDKAPGFSVVKDDLSDLNLSDLNGRIVLNIFPSIDTDTCAMSVRQFNQKATALDNTKVVCISKDLPFALARFCGAEGLNNVEVGSAFRSSFGEDYGVTAKTGPLKGLLSRAVVVIDENGKVIYTEQVAETADEPDYEAALSALN
ncbi:MULTISPECIES: thiol peroxidase [unclassified Methylophaga]|jgi:thiol peroxidase|uniref:thiol peroxidase n=1 Tax=unclassified Methylophaga TaxID=2629249 RepID=UPI000C90BBDD|nr:MULTISPECIES: thiol peroxidase [unclassified Methylophaga]MAK66049.1 lipid hydroperoxide peroxidase [Methylophaga sp.]MAY17245.1 lipid hydroperoxide peroxidase [Methylophaga sp.]HCD04180.1 thiol peroxidase [Methylophaga sp.]|tara:strand:- start:78092 stop:78586 length:495 start_codon:yes stop_codon:yes gene_type:complete